MPDFGDSHSRERPPHRSLRASMLESRFAYRPSPPVATLGVGECSALRSGAIGILVGATLDSCWCDADSCWCNPGSTSRVASIWNSSGLVAGLRESGRFWDLSRKGEPRHADHRIRVRVP